MSLFENLESKRVPLIYWMKTIRRVTKRDCGKNDRQGRSACLRAFKNVFKKKMFVFAFSFPLLLLVLLLLLLLPLTLGSEARRTGCPWCTHAFRRRVRFFQRILQQAGVENVVAAEEKMSNDVKNF